MDSISFYAFILGIIEGLTEFLPVSSTGHMILSAQILGIERNDFWKYFLIIIQLGSILAVIVVFWQKLIQGFLLWFKLGLGFFATGCIGFFVSDYLNNLFNGYIVAIMLILGGLIFIIIEYLHKNKSYQVNSLDEISYKQALLIGIIQSLAMIPGTSRSGASIIGGLLLGLNRKVAAEFSFLLAIPTMIVATAYSIYQEPSMLSNNNAFLPLLIGFVVSFFVAIFVIKFFLKFISKFDFIPFGVYRIILGGVFLVLYSKGVLNAWSEF
ncbi:undecaprenyl-diphosphate phosphatase [Campylobacter sp. LR291e]|nr:undecaprenyl-diphosphate phosphatase [Campylobacter sp. LR291e]KAA6233978.1 undecaprenyl-diphosphate phosphatase [Campylobacter sp. LR291e]